ncbi:DUF86 domain-containing protein [Paenibacillus nasutitermitis]|uniref:DUF86 domain-containing protein n=1 Tax=Paenibacillus nasutitermitis TaxID=1652958 RepID=A0A917DNC4_9BACL|nr:HepT-like ribonuclease domain-containing protein [Paenibacillus nasutitermitis]GGD54195.1 hypothetical protein GCM10010911_09680 [Paenibacillus nasutitermitis]
MYYVNREQISARLNVIPKVVDALELIAAGWDGQLLKSFAQERALHLAIETVTDVGSCLIDGFIMRDASSYEDIIDIIAGEGVFSADIHGTLLELVRLRKPLVQDYYEWDRAQLHPLTLVLPAILQQFQTAVNTYLEQELDR